ncbi:MbnP family copper-binding protein [Chitinimonas sp. BJB300]|uniref:MbnP family copper-binding protein n=1 Tax=Chitinimonas sp. BJB300 TaxID=1559339 RepID=UPI000C105823|nr:MbnP family copper-binding protein [Chitinimonas sp. BJB300]PHV11055.1 metallo-mystery pair system four-Cys motif protein [Chitinimonas sp. BJB300]TSJ90083.1 metallo-mystery pair system four-Cys motif protein [Chitinimonas sp. BJB300]
MMRAPIALLAAVPLTFMLAACGGSGGDAPTQANQPAPPTTQAVNIQFALKAGNTTVDCANTIPALGTGAISANLHDARLYIYDAKLINSTGTAVPIKLAQNDWQYLNLALLDFENGSNHCAGGTPAMNTVIEGTVPSGLYTGIAFNVGVPISSTDAAGQTVMLNHSNSATAPKPLDVKGMGWSWQGGRKFMQLELNPTGGVTHADGSTSKTWFVHLGSTGCTGNPATGETVACAGENRFPVRLANFNSQTQQVVLDIASLLQNNDLSANKDGASGCMSHPADPECALLFSRLDLNLTESAPGSGDAGKPKGDGSNQQAFRIEAK